MNHINNDYDKSFEGYKDSPQGFNWIDTKTRNIYFNLALMISSWKGQTCLDIGCGAGALWEYIIKNNKDINYYGLDINPKFITLAKQKYEHHRFICDDILSFNPDNSLNVDYALIPGTFNLLPQTIQDEHLFIEKVIKKTFKFCKKGVSFIFKKQVESKTNNSLKTSKFVSYDPLKLYEISKALTPYINLNESYSTNVASLFIYK